MELGIVMQYDFDEKCYKVYDSGALVLVCDNYLDGIKEFRSLQRQRDKEIE